MRVIKLSQMAFCLCFVIGLSVVALTPAPTQAIPTNCTHQCYVIRCGAPCGTFGLVGHWKGYPDGRLADPCNSLFNCSSSYVGCGGLCEQF